MFRGAGLLRRLSRVAAARGTYRRVRGGAAALGLLVALAATPGTVALAADPSPTSSTQDAGVLINDFGFRPPIQFVRVGEVVRWLNVDTLPLPQPAPVPHTATSDTGVFNSGALSTGASYAYQFTAPGRFPYHCAIHPFMRGTIIVLP